MKKLLLLITLITGVCLAFGAVNEYTFSQGTATYTEITGGTVVATGNTDDTQYAVPLPFGFSFNDATPSAMAMSSNGYLSFDAGTNSFGYTAISSTTTGTGAIAPLSRDLRGRADGEMRYEVFGTTPNQYAVYQWKNWTNYGSSYVNDNFNFQVILYEGTNQIAYVYGPFTWVSTFSSTAQVGLRGAANTDYINRTTTTDWSATTAGTSNTATCAISTTVYPPNGLRFLFAPPVAGAPPNPANLVYPSDGGTLVPLMPTLQWASGGGLPDGYKLYFGDTATPAYIGDLGNVTSWSPPADLNAGAQYWWQVVPYNAFGDAPGCPVWSFTTMPANLVQIGTGTAIGYVPVYPWYTYTYSQSIYTAAEIGAPGQISSLAWYWNGFGPVSEPNVDIYMGHTANATLTGFLPTTGMTLVYSGPYSVPGAAGWIPFTFTAPFIYNGTDNLVIAVNENGGPANTYYSTSHGFYQTDMAANRSWYLYQDAAPYDPLTVTGGSAYTYIPNVLLDVAPVGAAPPNAPNLTYPAMGQTGLPIGGFDLQWSPDYAGGAGVPDYYAVYMSMDESTIYGDYYWETFNTTFNPVTEGGVTFNHDDTWYWTVEAVNTLGSGVVDPPWRFDIISPPPQIVVNPLAFTQTMDTGLTATQTMTITNTGGLPLDFNIGFTDTTTRGAVTPFVLDDFAPNPSDPFAAERSSVPGTAVVANRALFDLQFLYPTFLNDGEYGIATDGNYFYTSDWSSIAGQVDIAKYALDGTYIEEFGIVGATNCRDLAYDGTYFYGAASATTIFQMDFNTHTLIGTITAPVTVRAIAYDPDTDTFWVGNGWNADLRQINRSGAQVGALVPAVASWAGMAYDNFSGATPTLWGNTQNGTYANQIVQVDIATGAVLQSLDVTDALVPGVSSGINSAGGMEIFNNLVPGYATIICNAQNLAFYGLELCQTTPPWVSVDPNNGTVPVGSFVNVDVNFDSNGVGPGTYTGIFTVNHNAPSAAVPVDVTLNVTGTWPAVFEITPTTWDYGTAEQLNPVTKEFTIRNTGGAVPAPLTINPGDIYMSGDAEGNFMIDAPGLPVSLGHNQTYSFDVTFTPQTVGAKTGTLNIQDNITRVVNTVPLMGEGIAEEIGIIVNLQGVVQMDTDVFLTWVLASSTPGTPGWIHYDDGTNVDGIGTGAEATFDVAAKFDSGAMYPYAGMDITHIKFFPRSALSTYTLEIWTGLDANLAPTTLVYSQPLAAVTAMAWNDITLTTPYPISGSEAVWFGYNVVVPAASDDFYPAGCDAGPAIVGYGDLIYFGGAWASMFNAYALNYNWNLQAYVDVHTLRGGAPLLSLPVIENPDKEYLRNHRLLSESGNSGSNRVLQGFNVYRNSAMINPTLVTTTSYLDAGLAPGTYTYNVQGVYYSGITPMSDPLVMNITGPTPYPLPFSETWVSGLYTTQEWTTDATNWTMNGTIGDPAPSAYFSWSPQITNYATYLTSYYLDGAGASTVWLSFEESLNNYSTAAENFLSPEVWNGSAWTTLDTYSSYDNSGLGWDWRYHAYDITPYAAGNMFRIRFKAHGEDSYEINYWYLDNINVYVLPTLAAPVASVSWDGSNVLVGWNSVPGAIYYAIYSASDPYGAWTYLGWLPAEYIGVYFAPLGMEFYKVTAGAGALPRSQMLPNGVRR
jgi:hypothetical protein